MHTCNQLCILKKLSKYSSFLLDRSNTTLHTLLTVSDNPTHLISFYIQCKPAKKKPQLVVPVYEEMTGVRPVKEKTTSCQMDITKLQEANSSVSALLSKENLYVKSKSTNCSEWGLTYNVACIDPQGVTLF